MTHAAFADTRVLIIEDDTFIRFTLKRMLRALGSQNVSEAADGTVALALLRDGLRPDLILCDVNMAPMDGPTFLANLRALPDSTRATIPVVMLSGESDGAVTERTAHLGVAGCLLKPVSMAELSATLRVTCGVAAIPGPPEQSATP